MAFIHHRADGPGLQFVDGHAGKNEVELLIGEWRRERIAEPQMHRRAQMRGAGMGIAELRGPDVDAMRLRPGKIACPRHEARSDSTAEFQQALRREIREAMKQMRSGDRKSPRLNYSH